MTRIGVFDSGLGGLTVLRELAKTNKSQYFYFGDSLRVPYGGRSEEELRRFSADIVDFLEKFDIDYYVIACNTLSVTVTDFLREKYDKKFIPITELALKASEKYQGKFLVLGTETTINSHFYKKNLEKNPRNIVYEVAASKLVDLIEADKKDDKKLNEYIDSYIKIANDKKIENILLACTHYPIIRENIERRLDYKANIIDPAIFLSQSLVSASDDLDINIFMSKKTPATENLIPKLIEFPYKLNYIKEGL
ncbi:MAG: glutamate racemase [Anaerococcus sp.]|uniref:glutamate racemase n=1 Tax=Anaerococcus sp. TaxID=1872515 RepID=UPI00260DDE1A|nr:glutamate racemase [Anaerococcus sp.]MCI5972028.1 glutamate racemase [Anaerococcus sp.]MDD6918363.1 glutamate racemase [Peptoniphilaceae bacterium]MDY2927246.1 glutamate racemase [Anaerococcus sp.]